MPKRKPWETTPTRFRCSRPPVSSTPGPRFGSRREGRRLDSPPRPGRGARRLPVHDRTADAGGSGRQHGICEHYVARSPETPQFDLTILRIRFGRLTLKIHTKGERVLRIEAMAHNAGDLGCRLGASYFPEAVEALRRMVDRFVEVLDCLDTTFVDAWLLDRLPRPGRLGAVRVGGIDINRPRARAVMQALLALSPNPAGFTSSELATKVARLLKDERHSPRRAAYDLRKFRCKGLAARIPRSRRYLVDPSALRAMAALLLLRDKVVCPLLAAASSSSRAPGPRITSTLDQRYAGVHHEMRSLFDTVGIAA